MPLLEVDRVKVGLAVSGGVTVAVTVGDTDPDLLSDSDRLKLPLTVEVWDSLWLRVPVGDRLVVADTEALPLGVVEIESDCVNVTVGDTDLPDPLLDSDRLKLRLALEVWDSLRLRVRVGDRLVVADTEGLPLGVVEIESDWDSVGVPGGVAV